MDRRPFRPDTVAKLNTAMAHLKSAMSAGKAMVIFGLGYWCLRMLGLRSTPERLCSIGQSKAGTMATCSANGPVQIARADRLSIEGFAGLVIRLDV